MQKKPRKGSVCFVLLSVMKKKQIVQYSGLAKIREKVKELFQILANAATSNV